MRAHAEHPTGRALLPAARSCSSAVDSCARARVCGDRVLLLAARAWQVVTVSGFESFVLADDTRLTVTRDARYNSEARNGPQGYAPTSFVSGGGGVMDPTDPMDLSRLQRAHAVTLLFRDVRCCAALARATMAASSQAPSTRAVVVPCRSRHHRCPATPRMRTHRPRARARRAGRPHRL